MSDSIPPSSAPSNESPKPSNARSLEALEAEAFKEALAEFGGGSGDDEPKPKPKKPASAPKPKPEEADDDGDETEEEETEEEKPKPDKKPKKPETLGESWKKVRETRDALKAHEAHLAKREETLKTREAAAQASGKEVEQLRAKAALVDRLLSGDPEALAGLNVDFEKLTEGYLKAQSGDGKQSRLERELQELKAKIAKADEDKTKAAEAQEHEKLYQQAVSRLTTAAKADKVLSGFKDAQLVAMGEQIALEHVQEQKPVPPPEEIAKIMARRIREEYKAAAARFAELDDSEETEEPEETEEEKPKPAPKKPSTVSRRDSAERASSKKPYVYDPDEEAAELLGVFRGGRNGRAA